MQSQKKNNTKKNAFFMHPVALIHTLPTYAQDKGTTQPPGHGKARGSSHRLE